MRILGIGLGVGNNLRGCIASLSETDPLPLFTPETLATHARIKLGLPD
jgi:hypothetical protein